MVAGADPVLGTDGRPTRSVAPGSTGPELMPNRLVWSAWCWSGRCGWRGEVVESAGEHVDPGCSGGKVEVDAPGMAGDPAGDRPQAQTQPLRLPSPGGMLVQGEHLCPGGQLAGELHDGEPDAVLVEPVQWKVLQAGAFRVPDAVLAAGATPATTSSSRRTTSTLCATCG